MIIIVEKVTVINYLKNGKSINPYKSHFWGVAKPFKNSAKDSKSLQKFGE